MQKLEQVLEGKEFDEFETIRDLKEEEIKPFLRSVIKNKSILQWLGSRVFGAFGKNIAIQTLISWLLLCWFGRVNTRKKLISALSPMVNMHYAKSSSIQDEPLDKKLFEKAPLILSNHRDIVCDTLYCNWKLQRERMVCAAGAVGDNLESLGDWGYGLIRAVGCFAVARSGDRTKEEIIAGQLLLSKFIQHLQRVEKRPVWISHRSGRTLDGIDKTSPNIFRMLNACQPSRTLKEFIAATNAIALTLSYEFDPCDIIKAKQFLDPKHKTSYVVQATKGLLGHKGRVTIKFSKIPVREYKDRKDLSQELDAIIHKDTSVWEVNYAAYHYVKANLETSLPILKLPSSMKQTKVDEAAAKLAARFQKVNEPEVLNQLYRTYAGPLLPREIEA